MNVENLGKATPPGGSRCRGARRIIWKGFARMGISSGKDRGPAPRPSTTALPCWALPSQPHACSCLPALLLLLLSLATRAVPRGRSARSARSATRVDVPGRVARSGHFWVALDRGVNRGPGRPV